MSGDPVAVETRRPLVQYVLALGDDALISAQRCGEWIASAPALEEDLALGNIGLDLIGQARALLSYAGEVEGHGRTEDDLAYFRDERQFLNLQICELPNEDFAVSMARLLIFSSYQFALYDRLVDSADATIAAVAGKAAKEVAYHRDHATQWVMRLGDGTELSAGRMQAGLDRVWPWLGEVFDDNWLDPRLVDLGIATWPSGLRADVTAYLDRVVKEARLTTPDVVRLPGGGRNGIHSEHLGFLLAELQHIARSHPGAKW